MSASEIDIRGFKECPRCQAPWHTNQMAGGSLPEISFQEIVQRVASFATGSQQVYFKESELRRLIAKHLLIKPSEVLNDQLRAAFWYSISRSPEVHVELEAPGRHIRRQKRYRFADPNYWRSRAKELDILKNKYGELPYSWRCFVLEDQEIESWNAGPFLDVGRKACDEAKIRNTFEMLAVRGVRRLGLASQDLIGDRNTWLNLLRIRHGVTSHSGVEEAMVTCPSTKPQVEWIRGSLIDVVHRSKEFCEWIESKATAKSFDAKA